MLARGTERRDLLETVQGYVILKAAVFETGHGFALGHNPGAPSPFVTWQFTEGENGHRELRYLQLGRWNQRLRHGYGYRLRLRVGGQRFGFNVD